MRLREKNCAHCQKSAAICYRIQSDASHTWQLVCPDCWQAIAKNNPHYRYGGTWKAKKKGNYSHG
ncbi:MAG: hypothetical protein HC799_10785 [Limnothrix sp. RL_2_0]|nr:hypothetical protein [Limnothrix sp. RL_2_0]